MDRMKAARGDDAHADGVVSNTSVDLTYDKMARPSGGVVGGLWRRQLMVVELASTAIFGSTAFARRFWSACRYFGSSSSAF